MNNGDSFRFDLWLYNEMRKREWNTMDMERATGLSHVQIWQYLHNNANPSLRSFALILKAFNKHIIIEDD